MFGKSEMSMVGTVEGGADPLDELGSRQQTSGFDHPPLAVDPTWARWDSATGS